MAGAPRVWHSNRTDARVPHVHKLSQRLSEETVAALVRDYGGGASLAGLQLTYSLGRGSVQRLLRQAGVRRRRKSLADMEIAMLVERYEAGLTIREIAAEQGLAKTTVQDALRRTGVVMRPAVSRSRVTTSSVFDAHERRPARAYDFMT